MFGDRGGSRTIWMPSSPSLPSIGSANSRKASEIFESGNVVSIGCFMSGICNGFALARLFVWNPWRPAPHGTSFCDARIAQFASCSIRGNSDVGMRKVLAFEEQGFALNLRQGVAETVAIVQARGMTPLAVATPGFARDVRLFCGDGLDSESRFGDQKVQFASASRSVSRFDDDAGFDKCCGGDQPIRIRLKCCSNSLRFRLHAEERDQCRRVDDHDRMTSGAGRARRTR